MTLLSYISKYYKGSQTLFASAVDVKPPQVTQWLKKKYIVINHVLYSPRRNLPLYSDKDKQSSFSLESSPLNQIKNT